MLELAHHDAETASNADLLACGADAYAEHESTFLHCLAYTFEKNDPPTVWHPAAGEPTALLDWIAAGKHIACWNSAFEEAIWRRTIARLYPRWPQPKLEQIHDIMAWALYSALPGALANCAPAMGLAEVKDAAGGRVMKQLMRPRDAEAGTWWTPADAPKKFETLYAYCAQDVITERAIAQRLRPLPPSERALWLLDRRINRRGVLLDEQAILTGAALARVEAERLNAEMHDATDGAVTSATNTGALAQWLNDCGVPCQGVAKDDVRGMLRLPGMPDYARRALEIRQEAGKASTAKLTKMLSGRSRDGRARDLHQYHGATTGRWAGRRIQTQNMPRPKLSAREVAECIELFGIERGADMIRYGYGNPLDVLSWSLRGVLIPAPGNVFVGGDFSNIEGRVLAWLAGEEWKLDAFSDFDAGRGHDLYKLTYARGFGVDPASVTDEQRQQGKVQELALGYQSGVGGFRSMAANYNTNLAALAVAVRNAAAPEAWDAAEAKRLFLQIEHGMHSDLPPDQYTAVRVLVDAWRTAHRETTRLWLETETAALSAVKYPGDVYSVPTGLVHYVCGKDFLYAKLPSGRVLSYARPSTVYVKNQFTGAQQLVLQYYASGKDRTGSGPKGFAPVKSYGGLLVENATQAVARDCLAEAMIRLEAAGYPVVLHVHDEARCEVLRERADLADVKRIMSVVPRWARGLPIAVGCETMERYHK